MKRVDANDAYALKYLGSKYAAGSRGLRQDWNKALELWARAAELGSSEAHNAIGDAYLQGLGVEIDRKKATHHFEIAASLGHEKARYNLGWIEFESDRVDRAIKHWIISASSGHSGSMPDIQRAFKRGLIQTDVYEQTLKAYDVSCAEMRSKARDGAACFH
jgi:TPR repeat protein